MVGVRETDDVDDECYQAVPSRTAIETIQRSTPTTIEEHSAQTPNLTEHNPIAL